MSRRGLITHLMLHTAAWCPEAIPILLANVLFTTAPLPNPPALRAAPFTKGGFWAPSFSKGGTGRISPAVSQFPARSAHDEAMTKEKSVLRKVAMREEQAGATPARAREEVGVQHEAAPAKAIGVAEAIRSAKARKVRHVRADKAVKGRSVVIGRSISDTWRGRLLNDDAC